MESVALNHSDNYDDDPDAPDVTTLTNASNTNGLLNYDLTNNYDVNISQQQFQLQQLSDDNQIGCVLSNGGYQNNEMNGNECHEIISHSGVKIEFATPGSSNITESEFGDGVMSKLEAALMPPPPPPPLSTTAPVSVAPQQNDTASKPHAPLAAMRPSKYANVDVVDLFPGFRTDKVSLLCYGNHCIQ